MEHRVGLGTPGCWCCGLLEIVPQELSLLCFWFLRDGSAPWSCFSQKGLVPARVCRAPLVPAVWENEDQQARGLGKSDRKQPGSCSPRSAERGGEKDKVSTDNKWNGLSPRCPLLARPPNKNPAQGQTPQPGECTSVSRWSGTPAKWCSPELKYLFSFGSSVV